MGLYLVRNYKILSIEPTRRYPTQGYSQQKFVFKWTVVLILCRFVQMRCCELVG